MATIIVYTDGGARGNPGPAGIGVYIKHSTGEELKKKRFIGKATNNQAEYRALIWACQLIEGEVKINDEVEYRLDSELVVKQMKGEYKVKDADLSILKERVDKILTTAKYNFTFKHVPRIQNKEADKLVNQALDERRSDTN